ncbi:hypothetical protein LJK88_34355 [Paenibacillus sp. P26]|nr:hypothetical protein LJK88_34355 [Paenibacillus sp. P26]
MAVSAPLGACIPPDSPLLRSPRVPMYEKLLFAVPAIIYWVMPDVLPWVPIDDMAVTLLLMNWFTARAERKYRV